MSTTTVFNGATSRLQAMIQGASLLDVPSSPAAYLLPFVEAEFNRNPVRSEDKTIRPDGVFDGKSIEDDEQPSGTITMPMCLNALGFILSLAYGAPTTTGAGPYTHTFTLGLGALPTALMEAKVLEHGSSNIVRKRMLGVACNQLSWDPMARQQALQAELMYAQDATEPGADFDTSPTSFAFLPAVMRQSVIADVVGSSTLGLIRAANITCANNLEGVPLANGAAGYGAFIRTEKPVHSGTLTALWQDGTAYDHGRAHTAKALKFVTKDASGVYSLTTNYPKVEFSEAALPLNVRGGIATQHNWRAYFADGDSAPTIVLVNAIESYA